MQRPTSSAVNAKGSAPFTSPGHLPEPSPARGRLPLLPPTWKLFHLGADAPEEKLWLIQASEVHLSRHSTAGVAASTGDVPNPGEGNNYHRE